MNQDWFHRCRVQCLIPQVSCVCEPRRESLFQIFTLHLHTSKVDFRFSKTFTRSAKTDFLHWLFKLPRRDSASLAEIAWKIAGNSLCFRLDLPEKRKIIRVDTSAGGARRPCPQRPRKSRAGNRAYLVHRHCWLLEALD